MPYWRQKRVEPAGLHGFKGDAVHSRRAVIGLGQLIRFMQDVRCADMDIQAPETPGWCSLRLGVSPPAQGLQTDWVSVSWHPCLPYCRRRYTQQGPFAPRAFPRVLTTTAPSGPLASSVDFPVVR